MPLSCGQGLDESLHPQPGARVQPRGPLALNRQHRHIQVALEQQVLDLPETEGLRVVDQPVDLPQLDLPAQVLEAPGEIIRVGVALVYLALWAVGIGVLVVVYIYLLDPWLDALDAGASWAEYLLLAVIALVAFWTCEATRGN